MSRELFHWSPKVISDENGRMSKFRDVMAAHLFMNFRAMEQDYGSNNQLINVISDAARTCDVKLSNIRKWGDIIQEAFTFCNLDNSCGSSLEQQALQEITIKLTSSLQENERMSKKVDNLQADISSLQNDNKRNHDALMGKLDSIGENVQNLNSAHSSPSIQRKRPRLRSSDDNESVIETPESERSAHQAPIRNDLSCNWFATNAFYSTMKHLISQVTLKGINFDYASAATILKVDSKQKSRIKFAHGWALTHCTEEEKTILVSTKKSPTHRDYPAFRSKVESAATNVMAKALESHKKMAWEVTNEKQKKRGKEHWEKTTYKYTPGQITCSAVVNTMEKHKTFTTNKSKASKRTNFFQSK